MRETEGGRKADKQREAQTSHLLIHSTKAQDLGIYMARVRILEPAPAYSTGLLNKKFG